MHQLSALWTLLPALVFSFTVVRAGEPTNILSHRRTQTISIDGNTKDWKGAAFTSVDASTSIAMANDRDSLYVCVVFTEQHPDAPFPGGELTIWMETEGSGSRKFAVHIPLVRGAGGPPPDLFESPDERPHDQPPPFPLRPGGLAIEVHSPGERDCMTVERAKERGILLVAGRSDSGLVFEARMPLADLGAAKGSVKEVSILPMGIALEHLRPMDGRPGGEFRRGPQCDRPGRGLEPEDCDGCDIDDALDLELLPND